MPPRDYDGTEACAIFGRNLLESIREFFVAIKRNLGGEVDRGQGGLSMSSTSSIVSTSTPGC